MHSDYAGASAALDAAIREAEQTEELFMTQVFKRLEGDIVLGLAQSAVSDGTAQAGISPEARAEELYRESVAISREREAKSFELQALLRLYDLLQGSPRGEDVLNDIRAVYETYTDGHDLSLLKRAKTILDSRQSGVSRHAFILREPLLK